MFFYATERFFQGLLVGTERDAHVTLPLAAEYDAGRDEDTGFVENLVGQFGTAAHGVGNLGPEEHTPLFGVERAAHSFGNLFGNDPPFPVDAVVAFVPGGRQRQGMGGGLLPWGGMYPSRCCSSRAVSRIRIGRLRPACLRATRACCAICSWSSSRCISPWRRVSTGGSEACR